MTLRTRTLIWLVVLWAWVGFPLRFAWYAWAEHDLSLRSIASDMLEDAIACTRFAWRSR